MSDQQDTLDVLTRVPTEAEANMIVHYLADRDIRATAAGCFTTGFMAEAPGEVSVMVKHGDLARAQDALRTVRQPRPSD